MTGRGWEEGPRRLPRGGRSVPLTPEPVPAPAPSGLARAARRLLDAAAAVFPPGAAPELAVRVTGAAVEVRFPSRRAGPPEMIEAATLLVGRDPFAPRWARTAPLERLGPAARWPAGWVEVAARESAVRAHALPAGDAPDFGARDGSLVVDAFAAGDLLRLEGTRWAEGTVDPGAPVAAARLSVRDTRFGGADRASRAGMRVESGRLLPGAWTRRGARPPRTGSWRAEREPPWVELLLEVGEAFEPWPTGGVVMTRILPLRGQLFGAGHLRRGGRAVARWGPVAIPPPAWFLARVVAALGAAVRDASGTPVACPPLAVRWGPRHGGR